MVRRNKNLDFARKLSDEYRKNNAEKLTAYYRCYYWKDPEKHRRSALEWHYNNPEKSRLNKSKWYRDNLEHSKECAKQRRLRNIDRYRENARNYRKANPERIKQLSKNRYARKRGAQGSHTEEEFKDVIRRQKGRCLYCGCKLTKKNSSRDHWIALVNKGSNSISNIVGACRICNARKMDKDPHVYMRSLGFLL
jgi:5-methylcytosine-specific restriction endonuclease McrA